MFPECSPNVSQAEEEIKAVKRFMTALSNVQKRMFTECSLNVH
jgi:hypothetical protein